MKARQRLNLDFGRNALALYLFSTIFPPPLLLIKFFFFSFCKYFSCYECMQISSCCNAFLPRGNDEEKYSEDDLRFFSSKN